MAKELSEFSPNQLTPDGLAYTCKACRAEAQRKRAQETPAEVKARRARKQRAGIRKGVCVTCGTAIKGDGFCERCRAAVIVLGDDPATLKRAAAALKWLQEE
ncbi:hypothetical protein [Streptomyces sp. NPDC003832]